MIEITGFCERTIRQTISDYKRGGMAALKPKTRGMKAGEKRLLAADQEKELIGIITDKNPDKLKMKCCLWTRDAVRQLIKDKYGIDMPIRTVGMYLQRWGFTVQRSAKQSIEQKPEAVQHWLKEEYPAIHGEAKKEDAEIFWGDETAVQNVANYARGYAPKGHTPVLKMRAKKMHIIHRLSCRIFLKFAGIHELSSPNIGGCSCVPCRGCPFAIGAGTRGEPPQQRG